MFCEQPDVLERPADPEADHVVGPRAAEDPGPLQEVDVPRRPDDRDDERGDQAARSPPGTSSSPPISRRAAMVTGGEDAEDERKREPEERLGQVRRGRATQARPANEIVPSLGSSRPAMTLKKVVLPAPLGPMRLTIEPLGMSKSMVRTATRPPNRFVIPRASSRQRRPLAGRGPSGARPADPRGRGARFTGSLIGVSLFRLDACRRIRGGQLVLGWRLVELASPAPAREQALRAAAASSPTSAMPVQQELVVEEVDVAMHGSADRPARCRRTGSAASGARSGSS